MPNYIVECANGMGPSELICNAFDASEACDELRPLILPGEPTSIALVARPVQLHAGADYHPTRRPAPMALLLSLGVRVFCHHCYEAITAGLDCVHDERAVSIDGGRLAFCSDGCRMANWQRRRDFERRCSAMVEYAVTIGGETLMVNSVHVSRFESYPPFALVSRRRSVPSRFAAPTLLTSHHMHLGAEAPA